MEGNRPDFFKKNFALLEKKHPHVWQLFAGTLPEAEGEIILAANGRPNLWTTDQNGNRISLHIPEDPEAETRQFLNLVTENFEGIVTITGMGLGYAPLALIKHRPGIRHLAVFEPNAGIFLQALHALDLSPLFSDPRTILGIGEDQNIAAVMEPAYKALQLESIHNLQHLPSFSLNFDKYKQLHRKVYEHCSSFNIEGNTIGHMGRDFLENRLRHLSSIHHDRMMMELAGKFSGLPAILVAAGPSLDKNVHLLTKAKGKAVIIAVDSALPTLIANGVMPDMVGTIDPLELIFEKVAAIAPMVHDVSLLCMSWASSKMVKFFPAEQVFWCFGAKPIEVWMATLLGCPAITGGAGTVAHLNFLASIIMGCAPIIFVGQDLAYSAVKSHSSHAVLQTKDLSDALQKGSENTVWLDGIEGGKVLSDRGFLSNKNHLEAVIKSQKGHYINATEGGAHIEGTEVMPLREVLDRYCSAPVDVRERLSSTGACEQEGRRKLLLMEFDKKAKLGRRMISMLEKADWVSRTILQHLDKTEKNSSARYRCFADLPAPIKKNVEELDRLNTKIDKETTFWPLFDEVTMAGLRRSEQQKHMINSLANDPNQYREWLRKNIQRFLHINKVRREVLPLLTNILADDVIFLQEERKLLVVINKEKGLADTGTILKLAHLYYEAGNLNLARPWIDRLSELLPESAEVNFLQGWVAAHFTEYDKAEALFLKAMTIEPDYADRVAVFRRGQGDAYVKYAAFFHGLDKTTSRRLLIKGLIYAPEHTGIMQQLTSYCDQALDEIKKLQEEKNLEKMEEVNSSWLADLAANARLAVVLGPDRAAHFHRCLGMTLAEKNDYARAAEALNNALHLTPDDPTLHISLTDMYFAMEQYPQGIEHLDKAVSLDSVYAVYWEGIGDSLANASQHAEALTAYEKCFTVLPERIHLLKKIGDCYMASGQLEAAREAYLLLKTKMQTIETTT